MDKMTIVGTDGKDLYELDGLTVKNVLPHTHIEVTVAGQIYCSVCGLKAEDFEFVLDATQKEK